MKDEKGKRGERDGRVSQKIQTSRVLEMQERSGSLSPLASSCLLWLSSRVYRDAISSSSWAE